ncbi:HAD family hydrolase [Marivita sp. S0852]|uniref:HAD family hydrolase n=1 Tax=Marivita sp. S0852 TaxID=3373893 RepID=UPI003982760E
MPRALLTLDFWDTLVRSRDRGASRRNRAALLARLWSIPPALAAQEMGRFGGRAHATLSVEDRLRDIARRLDRPSDNDALRDTARRLSDSLLDQQMHLNDWLLRRLPQLAADHRVAVVSNTGWSDGQTCRRLLAERSGLPQDPMQGLTWIGSDEVGAAKPDPAPFDAAAQLVPAGTPRIHIGDCSDQDVPRSASRWQTLLCQTLVTRPLPRPLPSRIAGCFATEAEFDVLLPRVLHRAGRARPV